MSIRNIEPSQQPNLNASLGEKDSIKGEYKQLVKEKPGSRLIPDRENLFVVGLKNPTRNRYSDIFPNEPTRVQIQDNEKFYFNANWVLGGEAIASQGPLPNEMTEFWQMVWHCDIQKIVMLTNLVENEKEKCSYYWGEGDYGDIHLKPFDESVIFQKDNRKIIKKEIFLKKGEVMKKIVHFQLENWPDNGVIEAEVLAELIKYVFQERGKLLAHCSAGIGRTGTFFTVYEAYVKMTQEIFSIALSLRDSTTGRVGSIQNFEQYFLAWETAHLLLPELSSPA